MNIFLIFSCCFLIILFLIECRVCHQWFMKPSISLDHVPLRQPTALTAAANKGIVTPRQASSHAATVVPNVSTRPAPLSRQISLPVTSVGNLLTMLTKPTQIPTLPMVTSNPTNTTTTTTNNVVSIPSSTTIPSTTVPIVPMENIITSKTETDGDNVCIVQGDTIKLFSRDQYSKEQSLLWEDSLSISISHPVGNEKINHSGNNTGKKGINSSPSKHVSPTTHKNKLSMDKITTSSLSCSNELLRTHPPSLVPSILHGQDNNHTTFPLTPTPPLAHELRTISGGVGSSSGRYNYTPTSTSTVGLPNRSESSPPAESSNTSDAGSKSQPKSPSELIINSTNSSEFSDEFSDPMGLEGDRVQTWRDRFSDNGSCCNSLHTSGGIFTLKDANVGPIVSSSNKPFLGIDRVDTERDNDSCLRMPSDKSGITNTLLETGTFTSPRGRVNFKEMATSAAEWLFTPKQPKSRQRPQLHLYY